MYDVNGHCKIVKIFLYYDPDASRVRITDLEGDFSWGFTLLAKIATARNKVMISGWAQSNNGIDKVEVKLDWGEYKEAYGYETWQYLLDVTDVPSFPHYHFITVKATDGEGKIVRTYLHLIVLTATERSVVFNAFFYEVDYATNEKEGSSGGVVEIYENNHKIPIYTNFNYPIPDHESYSYKDDKITSGPSGYTEGIIFLSKSTSEITVKSSGIWFKASPEEIIIDISGYQDNNEKIYAEFYLFRPSIGNITSDYVYSAEGGNLETPDGVKLYIPPNCLPEDTFVILNSSPIEHVGEELHDTGFMHLSSYVTIYPEGITFTGCQPELTIPIAETTNFPSAEFPEEGAFVYGFTTVSHIDTVYMAPYGNHLSLSYKDDFNINMGSREVVVNLNHFSSFSFGVLASRLLDLALECIFDELCSLSALDLFTLGASTYIAVLSSDFWLGTVILPESPLLNNISLGLPYFCTHAGACNTLKNQLTPLINYIECMSQVQWFTEFLNMYIPRKYLEMFSGFVNIEEDVIKDMIAATTNNEPLGATMDNLLTVANCGDEIRLQEAIIALYTNTGGNDNNFKLTIQNIEKWGGELKEDKFKDECRYIIKSNLHQGFVENFEKSDYAWVFDESKEKHQNVRNSLFDLMGICGKYYPEEYGGGKIFELVSFYNNLHQCEPIAIEMDRLYTQANVCYDSLGADYNFEFNNVRIVHGDEVLNEEDPKDVANVPAVNLGSYVQVAGTSSAPANKIFDFHLGLHFINDAFDYDIERWSWKYPLAVDKNVDAVLDAINLAAIDLGIDWVNLGSQPLQTWAEDLYNNYNDPNKPYIIVTAEYIASRLNEFYGKPECNTIDYTSTDQDFPYLDKCFTDDFGRILRGFENDGDNGPIRTIDNKTVTVNGSNIFFNFDVNRADLCNGVNHLMVSAFWDFPFPSSVSNLLDSNTFAASSCLSYNRVDLQSKVVKIPAGSGEHILDRILTYNFLVPDLRIAQAGRLLKIEWLKAKTTVAGDGPFEDAELRFNISYDTYPLNDEQGNYIGGYGSWNGYISYYCDEVSDPNLPYDPTFANYLYELKNERTEGRWLDTNIIRSGNGETIDFTSLSVNRPGRFNNYNDAPRYHENYLSLPFDIPNEEDKFMYWDIPGEGIHYLKITVHINEKDTHEVGRGGNDVITRSKFIRLNEYNFGKEDRLVLQSQNPDFEIYMYFTITCQELRYGFFNMGSCNNLHTDSNGNMDIWAGTDNPFCD